MTTLSKEQAAAMSDNLLGQERLRHNSLRNALSRFVRPVYRFAELSALHPWEQVRLIRTAGFRADKHLPVLMSGFLFVAAILSLALFAPPEYQSFPAFIAVFVCLGIPFALIRRATVHCCVLEVLAEESAVK